VNTRTHDRAFGLVVELMGELVILVPLAILMTHS